MNDWKDSLRGLIDAVPDAPPADGPGQEIPVARKLPRLDIMLDRKGRGGKTATIIAGFDADDIDAETLRVAAMLKRKLATGGSARGGEILLQGDRREQVAELLRAEGYKTRII